MFFSRSQRRSMDAVPIAVVDIGSNSVRLVVYEGAIRAPTPLFNEKIQCGLGSTLAVNGRLPDGAVERAVKALTRFRAIARTLGAHHVCVIATAAVREASNGDKFIKLAETAIQQSVEILSGEREAQLAGAGIAMGFVAPDGIAGDLGGGSLELVDIAEEQQKNAITLPIGGLRLASQSGSDLRRAEAIVDKELGGVSWIKGGAGRTLYPVGGTWRSIAKLHMRLNDYPLRVMHAYEIDADDFNRFCQRIVKAANRDGGYEGSEFVSKSRRELLPYGALVVRKLMERAKPGRISFSASGIREGLVYSLLSPNEQRKDPLIEACADLAARRSRSIVHAKELKAWTDPLFGKNGVDETAQQTRLQQAACLISDIGWRAHPDYRATQSLDTVLNSVLVSTDHPGRMFLAMSIFLRHSGLNNEVPAPYSNMIGARLLARARIVAGAVRTAHMLSAGMPGVIDETELAIVRGKLQLSLPQQHAALDGERLRRRLNGLAKLLDLDGEVMVDT